VKEDTEAVSVELIFDVVGVRVTLEWSSDVWMRGVLEDCVRLTVPEKSPRASTVIVEVFDDPTVAVRFEGVEKIS
jgi:hypothetical protein